MCMSVYTLLKLVVPGVTHFDVVSFVPEQVTNSAEVWRLYSDLYMTGDQDGDKDKVSVSF